MHGILLVDKPKNISSHGVVGKLRRHLNTKAIGHTGTLDPMATGLLVILVGECTKLSNYIMAQDKVYDAEVTFGIATNSDDAEGEITETVPMPSLKKNELERALEKFIGPQKQRPPVFSAISVNGERLYKKARRGEIVEVPERDIEIMKISILDVSSERCVLRIHCSKGTYIRSIARDLGIALGGVAHLSALRRIRSGQFEVSEAVTLKTSAEEMRDKMSVYRKESLGLPLLQLDKMSARDLSHGKTLGLSRFEHLPEQMPALAYYGDEIWAIVDQKDDQVVVKRGFGKQVEDSEAL